MSTEQKSAQQVTARRLEQTTEIVYVCSPDWQHTLFTSLRSLLASDTTFDRIVIYCVGKRPRSWKFKDERICVLEVPPLIDGYFLSNKVYLCQREVERVIFLDADTMILKSLDILYKDVQADFIARVAGQFENENWDHELWLKTLQCIHAKATPYFNSGLIIFQNGAHRRIGDLWLEFIRRNLSGELMHLDSPRFAEQLALSLAVGAAGLSYHLLNKNEHVFGWRKEPYKNAVVFHTSGPLLPIATVIEQEIGIADLDLPQFAGISLFNKIKLHRKFRHLRVKSKYLLKNWIHPVLHLYNLKLK